MKTEPPPTRGRWLRGWDGLEKGIPISWNEYRIRAEGPRIRLWLNGVLTVDYVEEDPGIATAGVIDVQTHAGAMSVIRYKDIVITELPATKGRSIVQTMKPTLTLLTALLLAPVAELSAIVSQTSLSWNPKAP